jgi:hypothetical protein
MALFLPECIEMEKQPSKGFQYVWMYDRVENAYLFCFKLANQFEKAIVFPHDHAGLLLKDERALTPFSIVLSTTEDSRAYLHLDNISFKRHPKAGW